MTMFWPVFWKGWLAEHEKGCNTGSPLLNSCIPSLPIPFPFPHLPSPRLNHTCKIADHAGSGS